MNVVGSGALNAARSCLTSVSSASVTKQGGDTPLHSAVNVCAEDAIAYLLSIGASHLIPDFVRVLLLVELCVGLRSLCLLRVNGVIAGQPHPPALCRQTLLAPYHQAPFEHDPQRAAPCFTGWCYA